jgi:hypothetical protein
MFLVAVEDVVGFCNDVNSGVYESEFRFTRTYARGLNGEQKLHGLPDLPEPWKGYLLKAPVVGEVVAVSGDGKAKVDLGTKDGLYAGMPLSARDGGGTYWTLKVESTDETSAVVSRQYPDTDTEPLRTGLKVASRFPEE